jgi:phosphoserine phosphatase
MENQKNNATIWKITSLLLAIALVVVGILYSNQIKKSDVAKSSSDDKSSTETVKDDSKELASWNDDAAAKKELTDYLKKITKEGSDDFIPVEDRIAVFDLDGTLACETDPCYFDHCIYAYRIYEDPDYKGKASDFEKKVAKEVKEFMDTGVSAPNSMEHHGKAVASAFAGMTMDEFVDYVAEYAKTPAPGYTNMTRGEAFYKPMIEVVQLLEKNDFKVYIVSGTDRFIVRGLIKSSPLNFLPESQLIGSDESLVASDQGDTDGLEYQFDDDDEVLLEGEFIIKNLDMNKVTVIAQEIGQQPVLSFGNSGSDSSMAEYVINDNKYLAKAFMLCCDDTERENGNVEKAEKMADSCKENGWTAISMKNDWKTIYGDNVKKK